MKPRFSLLLCASRWLRAGFVLTCLLNLGSVRQAGALELTNYNSAADDRFSSYPSPLVTNTDPSFIGAGYNFSGVGWAVSDATKSFALLSPESFLVARHYGADSAIDFLGGDGQVHAYGVQSVQDTGYGVVFSGTTGDISVGTLAAPIPITNQVTPYAILDLADYTNAPVIVYGHGTSSSARVGSTTIAGGALGSGTDATSLFVTPRTDVQLESGDSGSPAFIPWTDPTGAKQLTIIGNNAGIDDTYNYLNFLARPEAAAAMNVIMAPTGYALRWVADATTTWTGGNAGHQTAFNRAANWSGNAVPTTGYLGFNASTTSFTSVNLGGASQTATGLIFDPGTTAFTLSNGTLNLGHGGIDNYDTHQQTFSTNFKLTDSQFWDGHSGGLNVTGNINTNGNLLIVQGSTASSIAGTVSGTGSLAKDGSGSLTLSGANTYSGQTFLHNGTLLAENATGSATGSGPVIVEAGTLAGFGKISGNIGVANGAHLTAGAIASGVVPSLDSANQANNELTVGGDLTLHGAFDFYLGNLSELSGFTQLLLSGSSSLLTLANDSSFTLTSSNFTGIGDPNSGLAFWNSPHTWTFIEGSGTVPISGAFGSVNLGAWTQGSFALSTAGSFGNSVALSYNPVSTVPEPGTWVLLTGGLAMLGSRRRPKL